MGVAELWAERSAASRYESLLKANGGAMTKPLRMGECARGELMVVWPADAVASASRLMNAVDAAVTALERSRILQSPGQGKPKAA